MKLHEQQVIWQARLLMLLETLLDKWLMLQAMLHAMQLMVQTRSLPRLGTLQ